MWNITKSNLTKEAFTVLCKTNKVLALGVLLGLCESPLNEFLPSITNNYSHASFLFPLDSNEDLLESVLDCVEALTEAPAYLSLADEDASGYILYIHDQKIMNLLSDTGISSCKDFWLSAGINFIKYNYDKTISDLLFT